MNRFSKKFRVCGGICMLLNLTAVFLPLIRCMQENYADLIWTQLDCAKSLLTGTLPLYGEKTAAIGAAQKGWIVLLLILPLLLSLAAGVWSLVGGKHQKGSSLLTIVVLPFYIAMAATAGILFPEAADGETFCRGMACILVLVFSGCGALFALASFLTAPRKVKIDQTKIPQVDEIKQEQAEMKYNILMEGQKKQEQEKEQEKKGAAAPQGEPAHGVLIGMTGMYAGARIPLTDGENLLLGRLADNHLVFEGAPKVSRRHCRIKWDAKRQKYIFRDYSANGSFVKGVEDCLPQNLDLELAPGTQLFIGDENNTFFLK